MLSRLFAGAGLRIVVKENDVVVFMKGTPARPMCGFSRAVCQILDHHGVRNVTAVNVLDDEDIRSEIKAYSKWPTIPQVFVKGEFVGGCDIMMDMHRSGELDSLLLRENIARPADGPAPPEPKKKDDN